MYDVVYEVILYNCMDMSLMRDFMFVACTSWRTDERQPVRWARVQLQACNVRVQLRVQLYYYGVTY